MTALTKEQFLARVQADRERKKDKPRTRQPIHDYMHARRTKQLREVKRRGGW